MPPNPITSAVRYRAEDGREFVPVEHWDRLRRAVYALGLVMETPCLAEGDDDVAIRAALNALYRAADLQWSGGVPSYWPWEASGATVGSTS